MKKFLLIQHIAIIPMLAFYPLLATNGIAAGEATNGDASLVSGMPGWA